MPISTKELTKYLLESGNDFWTGVPCSLFKSLINYGIDNKKITYIGASSEGESAGIAMGAHLAGKHPIVMCQNSGLGNMVNPITSLYHTFKIPMLFVISHRGKSKDEPQHTFMGNKLTRILTDLNIDNLPIVDEHGLPNKDHIDINKKMLALLIYKDTLKEYKLKNKSSIIKREGSIAFGIFSEKTDLSRVDAISIIKDFFKDDHPLIATTGKTGRELFYLGHTPNQFYVVGGMGCASAIGLGVSLNHKKGTIIIDGDGAALMKMGNLATIGSHASGNLIHILLDNGAHESTGGQNTVSSNVDFATIAGVCGYARSLRCNTTDELKACLNDAVAIEWGGPIFIHVKVNIKTDPELGRPTLTPVEIKNQFMEFINGD